MAQVCTVGVAKQRWNEIILLYQLCHTYATVDVSRYSVMFMLLQRRRVAVNLLAG